MTYAKDVNRHHDLEALCFLLGETQCALRAAGFEAEALQVKAIHINSAEPERQRSINEVLPRHFPSVFVEKIPNHGIYKGEAR